MKFFIECACELIPPIRKIIYNLGTSPNGLNVGSGDMARTGIREHVAMQDGIFTGMRGRPKKTSTHQVRKK